MYESKQYGTSPSRHQSYPSMGFQNVEVHKFREDQPMTDNVISSSSRSPIKPYFNENAYTTQFA